MLAVVRRRVGVALAGGERLHRAPERRARLDDGDLVARVGQVERRGEPGQATADDHSLHRAATARTLPTAESRGRCENTS